MDNRSRVSRPVMLILALAVLFETWIWDSLIRIMSWAAQAIPWQRLRLSLKKGINRLPAIFAVLLFGVPVIVMESGSFVAVVLVALGHVVVGSVLYGLLKLVGVSLIAVIYDLTSEKLMTLPWFVWLHGKFNMLHQIAHDFLAPYRAKAKALLDNLRARAAGVLRRYGFNLPDFRARNAKTRGLEADAELD